jgi:hypothetical protein
LRHSEAQPGSDVCAHQNTSQHRVTPQRQALALSAQRSGKGESYLRLDRRVDERQGNVELAHGIGHVVEPFADLAQVGRTGGIQERHG